MYVYVPHAPLGGLHIILNNNNNTSLAFFSRRSERNKKHGALFPNIVKSAVW